MIDAKKAKERANAAVKKAEKDKRAAYEKASADTKRQIAAALKADVPKVLARLEEAIEKETKAGRGSAYIFEAWNSGEVIRAVYQEVERQAKAMGYKTQFEQVYKESDSYDEMGTSYTSLKVWWDDNQYNKDMEYQRQMSRYR